MKDPKTKKPSLKQQTIVSLASWTPQQPRNLPDDVKACSKQSTTRQPAPWNPYYSSERVTSGILTPLTKRIKWVTYLVSMKLTLVSKMFIHLLDMVWKKLIMGFIQLLIMVLTKITQSISNTLTKLSRYFIDLLNHVLTKLSKPFIRLLNMVHYLIIYDQLMERKVLQDGLSKFFEPLNSSVHVKDTQLKTLLAYLVNEIDTLISYHPLAQALEKHFGGAKTKPYTRLIEPNGTEEGHDNYFELIMTVKPHQLEHHIRCHDYHAQLGAVIRLKRAQGFIDLRNLLLNKFNIDHYIPKSMPPAGIIKKLLRLHINTLLMLSCALNRIINPVNINNQTGFINKIIHISINLCTHTIFAQILATTFINATPICFVLTGMYVINLIHNIKLRNLNNHMVGRLSDWLKQTLSSFSTFNQAKHFIHRVFNGDKIHDTEIYQISTGNQLGQAPNLLLPSTNKLGIQSICKADNNRYNPDNPNPNKVNREKPQTASCEKSRLARNQTIPSKNSKYNGLMTHIESILDTCKPLYFFYTPTHNERLEGDGPKRNKLKTNGIKHLDLRVDYHVKFDFPFLSPTRETFWKHNFLGMFSVHETYNAKKPTNVTTWPAAFDIKFKS